MKKTFRTLKKGDKILIEHTPICQTGDEVVDGTRYLSKIEYQDIEVTVINNPPPRPELTEAELKNMLSTIYVTTIGGIDIPYVYYDGDVCPSYGKYGQIKIL